MAEAFVDLLDEARAKYVMYRALHQESGHDTFECCSAHKAAETVPRLVGRIEELERELAQAQTTRRDGQGI